MSAMNVTKTVLIERTLCICVPRGNLLNMLHVHPPNSLRNSSKQEHFQQYCSSR